MTTDALSPGVKEELQSALERERDQLRNRLRELDEEALALAIDDAEEKGIGSGTADETADLVQRDVDLALKATLDERLEEVEEALARMEAGTYGTCANCGRPIGIGRLRAMPSAKLCIDCASGMKVP